MENILCSLSYIRKIQAKFGFKFTKSLGQNFLIDSNIPRKIAESAGITADTGVIEIGPGFGPLTFELCQMAKKVVAVELDRTLIPVLKHTLKDFNNLKVINADILSIDINSLIDDEFGNAGIRDIVVCANLPYYITTPILMHLLESNLRISSITLMIQKEVADRLSALPGGKDYGAITLAVNYYTKVECLFDVPPECFYPAPKVNSTVIKFIINDKPPVSPISTEFMFSVIKAAFAQRRKTLVNALSNAFREIDREEIIKALDKLGLDPNIRGERLSLEDFCNLSNILYKDNKKINPI